jgi:hypothetical protein
VGASALRHTTNQTARAACDCVNSTCPPASNLLLRRPGALVPRAEMQRKPRPSLQSGSHHNAPHDKDRGSGLIFTVCFFGKFFLKVNCGGVLSSLPDFHNLNCAHLYRAC